jgi:hypothetical protein
LIPDIQCPNWDNRLRRNSAANRHDPARFSPEACNNPLTRSMIPQSGIRFSGLIMLKQRAQLPSFSLSS